MTPEGKVKTWLHYTWLPSNMPGHWRVSPRGGPFGKIGCPDDIICWLGFFIAIEVKSDDGDPTPLQISQLQQIKKAGGFAVLLRGRDLQKLDTLKRLVLERHELLNRQL